MITPWQLVLCLLLIDKQDIGKGVVRRFISIFSNSATSVASFGNHVSSATVRSSAVITHHILHMYFVLLREQKCKTETVNFLWELM